MSTGALIVIVVVVVLVLVVAVAIARRSRQRRLETRREEAQLLREAAQNHEAQAQHEHAAADRQAAVAREAEVEAQEKADAATREAAKVQEHQEAAAREAQLAHEHQHVHMKSTLTYRRPTRRPVGATYDRRVSSRIESRAVQSVATVLVLGALLVGCGQGGSTSSSRSSPPPTTDAGSGLDTTGISNTRAVQQAVATCKRTVRGAPLLSDHEKVKLIAVCDRAASGDLAGAKRIAIDVCHDIIGALPEFVRTQAQIACPAA